MKRRLDLKARSIDSDGRLKEQNIRSQPLMDVRPRSILSFNMQSDWPVYSYYLEANLENRKASTKKRSSTDAIEDAFSQVMFGHSGLVTKLRKGPKLSTLICVIPVVVTTAALYSATFDVESIDLGSGTVRADELTVESLDCAIVNYHASDELKIDSQDVVRTEAKSPIESDIKSLQTRSIFVVSADYLGKFLFKLGQELPHLLV